MFMTNRSGIVVLLLLSAIYSPVGIAQPISLEPLEPMTWTVNHSVDQGVPVQLAFSLRAMGKRFSVGLDEIQVEEASYYSDPLSACAAILKAAITADEAWWGSLSATAADRGADGVPNSGYVPDSQANWYSLFTAHTRTPTLPALVGAEFASYVRLGGMHGFDARLSLSNPNTSSTTTSELIPIQEFSPGKFRFAPEWMGPNEQITSLIKNTDQEVEALKTYRKSNPAYARQVDVQGLFGETGNNYPLTLLFRAMKIEHYPGAAAVRTLQQNIESLAAQIPEQEAQYEGSAAQLGFENLLTESSLRLLRKQSIDKRRDIAFFGDAALVLDCGKFSFLMRRDERTEAIDKALVQIFDDNGTLKLANFRAQRAFTKFLYDPRVWGPLSSALSEILGPVTQQ